jgi:hypothetical protein
LFEEKDLEKAIVDRHMDLDLALSAADKVSDFLDSSLKEPFERYMVARLVSILYEETLDCSLGSEFEAKIRDLARQKSKKSDAE